jgi:hypothetical protein
MEFLIQTVGGEIKHDFSFTLIESIDYHNWFNVSNKMYYTLTKLENINLGKVNLSRNFIPIGSVEFVTSFLHTFYNSIPEPKNIPMELLSEQFTGRKVFNGSEKDIVGKKFVKSNSVIKLFTDICEEAPEGYYQISDVIDIQSEWRAFVFKGELVGLQNYLGDFCVFPNVDRIKEMIRAYTKQPIAYTLDIAVSNGKTVIIEIHDFFSCGLYGFADHKILPYMFAQWFREYVTKWRKR